MNATNVLQPLASDRIEWVTPERAKEYLAKNTRNRPVNQGRVNSYAASMRSGLWRSAGTDCIGFLQDGTLANGQHRLLAVIESGVPCQFRIACGLPDDSMMTIDRGQGRTMRQAFAMAGIELHPKLVSVAKALYAVHQSQRGTNQSWIEPVSDEVILQVAEFAAEPLEMVKPLVTKNLKRISSAPVTAAIASAWWEADYCGLVRFAYILGDPGTAIESHETAASVLRNYLLTRSNSHGGNASRIDTYYRTCTMLRLFLAEKPVTRIAINEQSVFTIPTIPGSEHW